MKRTARSQSKFAHSHYAALLIVFALVGGIFVNDACSQGTTSPALNTVTPPTPKPTDKAAQDLKTQVPLDVTKIGDPMPANLFIELSKLINPTVVSITTSAKIRPNQRQFRDPLQEFLEDFWGGRGHGMGGPPRQQAPMTGLGTGFLIRDNGLIITNNHVVSQADIIKVQLDNTSDKFYEAEVIGTDQMTDIALIKIDAKKPLPYARLGDSKDVQVGEWVAAFGNPYGHAHTMTKGIVSAIGREIAELNRFPFIQTDASINPGNSGGPLVNSRGLVIGVNTAIDARAQGIGFAIPIDNVKQIVAQLEKDGRVRRGIIGVGIASIEPELAMTLGMSEPSGVLIAQVQKGSPADRAGIQPYDIIVEFNGKKVEHPAALQNAVAGVEIGSNAKVKIWRFNDQGKRKVLNLTVKVIEDPEAGRPIRKKEKQYFGQKAPFDLGFKVADFSRELANEYGLPEDGPKNPVITEVDPKSPAGQAGLMPGDQILDVNRAPVSKATEVVKTLRKGRNILRLIRGNLVIVISIVS